MTGVAMIFSYFIGIFILFIIGDRIFTIGQRKYFKLDIKDSYGNLEHIEKIKIKKGIDDNLYRNERDRENFFIDDITWNDLNLDSIYKLLANLQSVLGREMLYKFLRIPSFNIDELKKRNNIIEYFRKNSDKRFKIQYMIRYMLGRRENMRISGYFEASSINKYPQSGIIYKIARYTLFLEILIGIVTRNYFMITIFVANVALNIIAGCTFSTSDGRIEDFEYIMGTIRCAFKIKELNIKELDDKYPNISSDLANFKSLKSGFLGNISYLVGGNNGILKVVLDFVFLKGIIDFRKVQKELYRNIDSCKRIYEYVGEIDTFIGIASFKDSQKSIENPQFMENLSLSFEDIYNPIIEKPVLNSFNEDRPVLITGSNASGKSTFLRSIGVNMVLAQSFYMVCAKNFKAPMARVLTSMALTDDILDGDSYYMVEIKALKRILDRVDDKNYKVFCIVDEILRGTNTTERISAATAILNYIEKSKNAYCVSATHDIELTYILEKNFSNYSFEERVVDNDITFDYKLKEGRSKTRNAIKILEFIGYNKSIISEANRNIEKLNLKK